MKRVWTWVGITLLGVGWALPVAASGVLAITDTIETENNLYLKTSVIAPDGNAAYFGTFSILPPVKKFAKLRESQI